MNNPFYRVLVLFAGLYAIWYGCYEFILKPAGHLDDWIIGLIVSNAKTVFEVFGTELIESASMPSNWIAIEGSVGVIVGPPCNGLALFALFLSFMFAFPGPIKHKSWYIPLGVLLIHLINILRVIFLVVIVKWNEEWLEFNHDYTFTILVYLFVFALWYIWIKKFSPVKSIANEQK